MRFRVCVSQGSTLAPKTTLTEEARGAKAAAEAGSSCGGISEDDVGACTPATANKKKRTVDEGLVKRKREGEISG
ncbi:hypothetical protein HYQ44_001925 [Verticillium longisporum]|nr:hypothetical protein HYQ44_001925 [Verticillium longisporum]